MHLVVGGAYQGKTEYVRQHFHMPDSDILDGNETAYERLLKDSGISSKKSLCIRKYHMLVRKLYDEGEDAVEWTKKLLRKYPDVIIILDEIGNGIVPIDKDERRWREVVGKTGCYLAAQAETVARVTCGIAVRIK